MRMPREPDVLVVGLGPAGARAAAAAVVEGATVLALDRRKEAGHPVQCAEFIPALAAQEFENLDTVTRQRIEEMVTFVEESDGDTTHGFSGRMIDRKKLDADLVHRAEAAGATCRFGVQVREIGQAGNVSLSDGSKILPKIIIGADGPKSLVGSAAGQLNHAIVETRQITVPMAEPYLATDIFLSPKIPGGYGWLFPRDGFANIGLGVEPSMRHCLKPVLESLHQRLIGEGRVETEVLGFTGGAIPVGGMLQLLNSIGPVPVLLAGDAAGLTNPVTGAGILSAAISGALAGEAAAFWAGGDPSSLVEYSEEVTQLFKPSLDHALMRRTQLNEIHKNFTKPTEEDLRRGWIAYPEFWARDNISMGEVMAAE
jgi:digeranylgeranylglycerophospholipid reductase